MPKKQKYYFIALFFIIFLSIAGINVRAHPPDDMSLEYNSSTNILKVSITHGVTDNTSHYVISVIISVNGSVDQTQFYTSQPDVIFFIYEYTVVTNNGSIIQVTASCSQGGAITKTLGGTNEPFGGIPGYVGFYLILVISVVTLVMKMRKKLSRL